MGKIKKILENELVGGTQSTDVYPVTSVKAVYDENNERLDHILNRRGVVNISTNYNNDHIVETLTLSQAIAKVPSEDRILGFQGRYKSDSDWYLALYTGEDLSEWNNVDSWVSVSYTELGSIMAININNATYKNRYYSNAQQGDSWDSKKTRGPIENYSCFCVPLDKGHTITVDYKGNPVGGSAKYITIINSDTMTVSSVMELTTGVVSYTSESDNTLVAVTLYGTATAVIYGPTVGSLYADFEALSEALSEANNNISSNSERIDELDITLRDFERGRRVTDFEIPGWQLGYYRGPNGDAIHHTDTSVSMTLPINVTTRYGNTIGVVACINSAMSIVSCDSEGNLIRVLKVGKVFSNGNSTSLFTVELESSENYISFSTHLSFSKEEDCKVFGINSRFVQESTHISEIFTSLGEPAIIDSINFTQDNRAAIIDSINTIQDQIGTKRPAIVKRNYAGNLSSGYYNQNGSLVQSNWWHCTIHFLSGATIKRYAGARMAEGLPYAILYNAEGDIVEYKFDREFEITVDYDGYIIANCGTNVEKLCNKDLVVEVTTKPSETEFSSLFNSLTNEQIDTDGYYELNKLISQDGSEKTIVTGIWGTFMYVPITKGAIVSFKTSGAKLSAGLCYIAFYNTDKVFIRGIVSDGASTPNYTEVADADGYVCAVATTNRDSGAFEYSSIILSKRVGDINRIKNDISEIKNDISEIESEISGLKESTGLLDAESFKGFYKFGVIGDSLSTGHMTDPTDSDKQNSRNLRFSWGQILARKNGQVCLNFGFSGATATTWFTNSTYAPATKLAMEENICQCYIIGMGANSDAGGLGSIEDIDWDNGDNNASTYYGQYARIIQLIRKTAPKAVIFCLTLPYPRESSSKNAAIKAICSDSHVSDHTFVIDLVQYNDILKKYIVGEDEGSSPATYNKYYYNWHFTAAGYALCARLTEYAISKVMDENANNPVILSIGQIPFGDNDIIE